MIAVGSNDTRLLGEGCCLKGDSDVHLLLDTSCEPGEGDDLAYANGVSTTLRIFSGHLGRGLAKAKLVVDTSLTKSDASSIRADLVFHRSASSLMAWALFLIAAESSLSDNNTVRSDNVFSMKWIAFVRRETFSCKVDDRLRTQVNMSRALADTIDTELVAGSFLQERSMTSGKLLASRLKMVWDAKDFALFTTGLLATISARDDCPLFSIPHDRLALRHCSFKSYASSTLAAHSQHSLQGTSLISLL